jgi:hypothetical protein
MDSEKACALLYRHWRNGTQFEGLPPDLVPADRAEAYCVQACIEGYSAKPPAKDATTSNAGQAHRRGRATAGRPWPSAPFLLEAAALGTNLMKVASWSSPSASRTAAARRSYTQAGTWPVRRIRHRTATALSAFREGRRLAVDRRQCLRALFCSMRARTGVA